MVLEHGDIKWLHGHLSEILMREGDIIPASNVVAIYYQFLQRIGHAEDPDYVTKVRQIARTL